MAVLRRNIDCRAVPVAPVVNVKSIGSVLLSDPEQEVNKLCMAILTRYVEWRDPENCRA